MQIPSPKISLSRPIQEEITWSKNDEALVQAAQRTCGCLNSEGIQGQVRWVPEQSELVGGDPARGLQLHGL